MSSEPLPPKRRLHPAAIGVMAVSALKDAAFPAMAAFAAVLFGGGADASALGRALGLAVIGAAVAAIAGFVRWSTTEWEITPDAVRVRRGVLSEKITTVPLARVQALDTVQGPLQRLFGVVAVDVQAAGGGRAGEIRLEAVAPEDLAELRAAVGRDRVEAPAPETDAPVERLGAGRLALAAVTAGQIGIVLPVLAAALQGLDELLFGDEGPDEEALRLVPDTVAEALLVVGAILAVGWLLSMAGTVISFAGFRVRREPERLLIVRGLVQRREATVPVRRVHAVRVVEGVLRRPFGLAALRVEVMGYASERSSAQTLFPLLRRSEVGPFLERVLPELADAVDGLTPLPRRALPRYLLRPAFAAATLGGAAALAIPGAGAWPLLAAPLAALYGAARFRAAGWRLRDGRLAMRGRRLAVVTVLAPARFVQQEDLSQSILQRRAGLASVAVAVGAGTRARVAHLDETDAGSLFAALGPSAARARV